MPGRVGVEERGTGGGGPIDRSARMTRVAGRVFGGPHRVRLVMVLAATLGLDGAGKATTVDLERAFGVGHTQIGLLASVASLATAVCILPAGVLADRLTRTRLLCGGVACWGLAMAAAAAAPSYGWLLAAHVLVGASVSTAIPAVASLVGDDFPAVERARVYGLVLCGELVGTGVGFLAAGRSRPGRCGGRRSPYWPYPPR